MRKKKLRVGIATVTDCEGCLVEIFNLGKRFLDLLPDLTLANFKLLEDLPDTSKYDIGILEGCPVTKRDFERMNVMRAKSKILIALGACACLGGVAKMKNYGDKKALMNYVYKKPFGIDNPDIKPIKEYVKVDLEIPGCPMNGEEFLRLMKEFLEGKTPVIAKKPVCAECPLRGDNCLLNKGKICFGVITLAGCGAPCPSSGFFCDGCRGPIKEKIGLGVLQMRLKEKFNEKEALSILERFGAKDYYV